MRKLLFILFTLMTFVFSGCTPKITGDEKIAEDFVKSKGYTITARKGQIQKYILSSVDGKTLEEVTGLSLKQWQDNWKKKE